MNVLGGPTRSTSRSRPARERAGIAVGLINNMGDRALKITERQFGSLVSEAASDIGVSFRIFALKSTPRSPRALDYINARYESASAAMDGELDALIITGAQPRATLAQEYRRDMDRYLRGETERKPARPGGYFGAEAEAELRAMERRAQEDRSRMQIKDISIIDALAPAEATWREEAIAFYRSWIEMIANANIRTRAPLNSSCRCASVMTPPRAAKCRTADIRETEGQNPDRHQRYCREANSSPRV
jgi:hypothetical protein